MNTGEVDPTFRRPNMALNTEQPERVRSIDGPRVIFWIGTIDSQHHEGGGGTAARMMLATIAAACPQASVIRIEPFRVKRSWGGRLIRQGLCVLRSVFSRHSAKMLFDADGSLPGAIARSLQEHEPDLLVWFGASAWQYADAFPETVPAILLAQNVEFELYRRQLLVANPLIRLFLHRILNDLSKYEVFEREVLTRCTGVVAVSLDEAADFLRLSNQRLEVETISAAFHGEPRTSVPAVLPGRRLQLGFLAKIEWWPNRESLDWLLREVWPLLSSEAFELHLYGAGSQEFHTPGRHVLAHGFVPDLNDFWCTTAIFLNPMLSGGGVNIKICEALYRGVPVLSTRVGVRGLPSIQDPALEIADTVDEWRRALEPTSARALARRAPLDSTRRHFSREAAVERFTRLVERI